MNKKTICFIFPYPVKTAPSQRFRMEQYFDILRQHGYKFTVKPFISKSQYEILYHDGKKFLKLLATVQGFINRLLLLFTISRYEFIFIHREATPLGPPIVEWVVYKIFRKKIIYDFDDAIWSTDREREPWYLRILKWRSKVALICRWSYKVSCGNEYLADYAVKHNSNVTLNPTTIDTEHTHNPALFPRTSNDSLIIGWTGSHSTLKYLEEIESVLKDLEEKYPSLIFRVIADKKPDSALKNLDFKLWSSVTEIGDLAACHIGVMPLPDDKWTQGKGGFKALQYMALEIPAVVSPVGINIKIIRDGVEGFLCSNETEWFNKLELLIKNPDLRMKMGKKGRERVINQYSVISNAATFLSLFE
jgi:glycosyltransferase involved in cell wall biosynthesis